MIYGLYIGNESRPLETGERADLRKLVRQMTSEQLRDGWTIAPFEPALVIERERPAPSAAWVTVGAVLLLFALFIVVNCWRT